MKSHEITPVIYTEILTRELFSQITEVRSFFENPIVLVPRETDVVECGNEINWITYNIDDGKSAALNRAVKNTRTPYLFYLEHGEWLAWEEILNLNLNKNEAAAFQIEFRMKERQVVKKYVQPRLFPVPSGNLFEGFVIPDTEAAAVRNNWNMVRKPVYVQRNCDLIMPSVINSEAGAQTNTRQSLFWQANLKSEQGEYEAAEHIYRKLTKNPSPFEFQRLAELNGLANALAELKRFPEAIKAAQKSLDCSVNQKAPYLTLFEIHFVKGNYSSAYENMHRYLEIVDNDIQCTCDIYLPVSESHLLMAESCFKLGEYPKAFFHYEKYYKLVNGNVDERILEKLFIYSIELKDYENSVKYFYNLFEDHMLHLHDESRTAKMFESLSLFMDNGWHEFVCDFYEQLNSYKSNNDRLMQGWIAALVKANKIDKAQSLVPFAKKKRKAGKVKAQGLN